MLTSEGITYAVCTAYVTTVSGKRKAEIEAKTLVAGKNLEGIRYCNRTETR
jgi:hypothetical protein